MQRKELIDRQNQLEESRDEYADLYDFAPIGYLTLSSNGIIKDINITGARLLGFERKFILTTPFIRFLVNGQSKKFFNYLTNCKNSNFIITNEFLLRNKNLSNLNIELSSLPVYDYKNKEINFRVSIIDITQKKIIENELKESEERFRLMAEATPAMIWMIDRNNKIEYLNNSNLNFIGKTTEKLKDKLFFELFHPEDRERFRQTLSDASENRMPFSIEIRKLNKDGEYRWVLNSGSPRYLPDGTFSGFIGSSIDITDRRIITEQLQNSLKEKEILIKEVHHRVKNNLQIISSILSLQSYYTDQKPVSEILAGCRHRVLSMSLLHEQLYHSNNLISINFENYVKVLIRNLVNTYRAENVNFSFLIADINFDLETSINLGLILNELITNSLKYAFIGKGGGNISISLNYSDDNELQLNITDDGNGLPDNFDVENLKSLGLELVLSLIKQLEGKLNIIKNGKTGFEITFPFNTKITN